MRATERIAAGAWSGEPADEVLIDHDHRHRRRITLTTARGATLLLDLPSAVRLRDGDALAREDGTLVRVRAKPEPLLEIHAHDDGALLRIAWHLGNRHLPVQLVGNRIRIRADHVIADMVRGLGGHAEPIEAPFDPEDGAYANASGHHHDHHHHDP
ncbi:MAG TPA: urease accessory protein UreE [Acidisphaera sp.]|nr:urease accessory protein UreE [Acidisphaera sp.]